MHGMAMSCALAYDMFASCQWGPLMHFGRVGGITTSLKRAHVLHPAWRVLASMHGGNILCLPYACSDDAHPHPPYPRPPHGTQHRHYAQELGQGFSTAHSSVGACAMATALLEL